MPAAGRGPWFWLPPALLLGAGLLLSAFAMRWQADDNARRLDAALRSGGEVLADDIAGRMQRYEYGLRGARGAVLAVGLERLNRNVFRAYHESRDLEREFNGARGFGFIRRVPAAGLADRLAAARRAGAPDYALRPIASAASPASPASPVTPGMPGMPGTPAAPGVQAPADHYVIELVEPLALNFRAIGLDIGSEPQRRAAADRAARTGEVVITPPITLSEGVGQPLQSFLILLPVYRPGPPPEDPEARLAATVGWTFAPLRAQDVLKDLDGPSPALAATVADVSAVPPLPFHDPPAGLAVAEGSPVHTSERQVFGRRWRIEVQATPAMVAAQSLPAPAATGAAGALVSGLAAALLGSFLRGRRSDRQVRAEQRRLAAVVENSSDAMITESADGRITGWNRAATQLLGYRAEEVLGRDGASLLLAPERQPMARRVRERLARGEVVEPFDQVLLGRDGRELEMSIAVSPLHDARGRLVSIGRTLRDISARSAAERQREAFTAELERQVAERTVQLTAARHDLQAVLDAVPSMIGYWDRALNNRFANRAYRTWLGVEPAALAGCSLRSLIGEQRFERNRPHAEAALRGEPQQFERTIARADGDGVRHAQVHYIPDVLCGEVRGFYVLVHDITALHRSQRRLADSEDLLLRVGRVAGVGGWEYRLDDRHLRWTPTMCRIIGVPEDHQPQLEAAIAHYPEAVRPAVQQAMQAAIDSGSAFDEEWPFDTYDGRRIWVRTVGEGVSDPADPGGPPVRVVGAFQDITQRRAAEQALREATRAAQAASAAKSAFLANMSHEIRTPLNAMIGLGYLLEHTRLDADQRGLVSRVQLAGRSLMAIVNDVLDLAKIEAGESRLDEAPFDLHELLDGLAAMFGEQAQLKGLAFRLSLPEDLPRRLVGDAGRLRQVLSNLLGNAIKFTERGSVGLVVTTGDADLQRVPLRFEVHDSGIGIAPAAREALFQPFVQADPSTTRRYGGTGLGLSIVRELVALMGGEVGIDGAPGTGSRFHVSLAFGRLGQGADGVQTPGGLGLRVLVIGGDAAPADGLAAAARALGWRVETAHGSADTLQALRAGVVAGVPTVLLVADDEALPAPAALADAAALAAAPPVVLLGPPPPAPALLFEAVHRALWRQGADPEAALRGTRLDGAELRWLPGARLLVVDDSDINREVASRILRREGAIVSACGSGAEALALLQERPADFDLVLMDVQMPGMDGHEATRRLRAELGLGALPVLALTAGVLLAERQRALEAGMNDFVGKPLEPDGLIRIVRRHVERFRGAPLAVQPRSGPAPRARTDSAAWPAIDGIDRELAAQGLDDDPALFRSLLERLFREFEDLAERPPLPPRDDAARSALARRAHKLRGSAGMLGARAVQQAATALEAALRRADGEPPAAPMAALADALLQLRRASAAALAPPLPAADAPPAEAWTAQARADLVARLRQQDLTALDRFAALASALRTALDEARFEALREAVENLRFEHALTLIEETEPA